MLPQRLHQHISELLSIALQKEVKDIFIKSIGGGSINQTYQLQLQDGLSFFCKINNASDFPHLFLKEKRGLEILGRTGAISVPQTVVVSTFEDQQMLILEWIESGVKDKSFFKDFGKQLATLHQFTQQQFGLEEDNYMGSVPQYNKPMVDWNQFFMQNRLQPMVKACFDKALLTANDTQAFERLYKKLPQVFNADQKPSLLHGDLWSGNYMCNKMKQPVLIDPAVYYGHPAVDLGMTTLFGGFDKAFYESYHYHAPLPPNHQAQWQLCNLYPLLIHLLLFGKSYYGSIQHTLKTFA
jgi:protein-ribulosamine 3-kinase